MYLILQEELLHLHPQEPGFDQEGPRLRGRNHVKDDVFEPVMIDSHMTDRWQVRGAGSYWVGGRSWISSRTPFSCSRAAL